MHEKEELERTKQELRQAKMKLSKQKPLDQVKGPFHKKIKRYKFYI